MDIETGAARQRPLQRSVLVCPGSNPSMISKAAHSAADAVVIDLEDAVAADEKASARAHTVAGLRDEEWTPPHRGVRINPVASAFCIHDITEVVAAAGSHLDVVVVPKVASAREVWWVDDALTGLERNCGLAEGGIAISVLIEEPEALLNLGKIAAASRRLESLVLGVGDLAAALGMRVSQIGGALATGDDPWPHARAWLIAAARAHDLEPIDGPYAAFHDLDGFRTTSDRFAAAGGGGRWCIHPLQIPVANAMFAPTDDEVATANEVLAAIAAGTAAGRGAGAHAGIMIDAASQRHHERVLARADQCARRDEAWS